jgi:hypothetical protein
MNIAVGGKHGGILSTRHPRGGSSSAQASEFGCDAELLMSEIHKPRWKHHSPCASSGFAQSNRGRTDGRLAALHRWRLFPEASAKADGDAAIS